MAFVSLRSFLVLLAEVRAQLSGLGIGRPWGLLASEETRDWLGAAAESLGLGPTRSVRAVETWLGPCRTL